jgi:hypothetical protein
MVKWGDKVAEAASSMQFLFKREEYVSYDQIALPIDKERDHLSNADHTVYSGSRDTASLLQKNGMYYLSKYSINHPILCSNHNTINKFSFSQ